MGWTKGLCTLGSYKRHEEPYEARVSSTDLWEPEGEDPLGDSTNCISGVAVLSKDKSDSGIIEFSALRALSKNRVVQVVSQVTSLEMKYIQSPHWLRVMCVVGIVYVRKTEKNFADVI